ncbi:hypothetical protein [Spirillospora sp. CA-294931]|uniref:hypothetical protein n=1 Tax=Spirillospora sp. CA-294931 TaxID=3240042 RepID=UPI003D904DB1
MRRQTFAALALVPALLLGLPACGDDGKNAKAGTTAKAASDTEKMRKFAACMRENGVQMDDPGEDGGVRMRMTGKEGDGEAKMKAAESKCRHLRPDGGEPKKLKPEDLAKMRQLAKCMRENGVDMPDPDADGRITVKKSGPAGGGAKVGGPDDPEFKEAQKKCRKYEPKRPGSGS